MKYFFCTLFDKNYLYRGLTLYQSLLWHCPDFKIWILAMDDLTYKVLGKMNLDKAELISPEEFEDKELLDVKKTRDVAEYSWTSKPSLLIHILKKNPQLDIITYLDSDCFCFSNPEPLYKALNKHSIGITPHQFPLEKKYLERKTGIYNAGILIFRNDKNSLDCLEWYRKKCLEWCFFRHENGKIGDQGYLNDWPKLFLGVQIITNKGVNLAPWNIKNYDIKKINNKIFVDQDPLVFYHFHSFKIYSMDKFQLFSPAFNISKEKQDLVYQPYIVELTKVTKKLKLREPDFNCGLEPEQNFIEKIKDNIKIKIILPFLELIKY